MLSGLKSGSEFNKNVLTLMTGSTIAQAIPIAITPILTRMYSPADFGILALFISITAILGSVVNGRYELAIMLPEEDDEAINIAALGLLIGIAFSIFLFLPITIYNSEITRFLGNADISFWLYFVPFVVLMMGLFNVLNYLNTRKKLYKDIAKANVYKATAMSAVQLSFGVIKSGATGLISGQIVSQLAANFRLAKNAKSNYNLEKVNFIEIKRLAKRYIDFPKFSMWAVFSNSLAYNLTNIFISIIYNVGTLGFYSLAQRILGLPASLIGASIGQVYFQEAVNEKQRTGVAIKTFDKTSKKLFLLSILFFTPLYFVLPLIFEIVFGIEWRIAGEYAQIILPFVALQFIVAAVSNTNNIFEKQKIALLWQLGLLLISASIILYANYFSVFFTDFIFFYTIIMSAYYMFLFYILRIVARGKL
ncbi:oligosaccharide flippase family protein [Simiduia curdlanivorans]|uniref:Lipopolysaccharide biosynthesis protein n=1 Tax=Simiduia curdlanivorans TaxID=1492769 RepID=A0ABV8V4D7_9GAMM|nr:oligosaccharide flippase family protein [Simiduia curdlanivorans]MDN3639989.1 oligosaccharide flippase family protein [Simiduia curdlanivorans]